MKSKLMVSIMFLTAAANGAAFADEMGMRRGSYGMAGCGLGSMVFEKNSQVSQVFAATTNGTFGTQTFGISSGTSNCTSKGVVKIEKEQEVFVSMNYDTLSEEMAKGSGETLVAFANLLGCGGVASDFGKMTQSKYETLSKAGSPDALLGAVKSEVSSSQTLSQACSL